MFTGIIEEVARVDAITEEGGNTRLRIQAKMTPELQIDQSVAHNGVCLTVVAIDGQSYEVQAVQETLDRSNLGNLVSGDAVNLERCTQIGDRLDGHIVQGHVDCTGQLDAIEALEGSTKYWIRYSQPEHVTVEKGSITINGVSLTVVDSEDDRFSVVIIPFTQDHTNFHTLKVSDQVNLEFDIIGKYVSRLMARR
jgi:riboflavin synthase